MSEVLHNIPPVYDENCRVLILGSFPSVKSREAEFFYGHPQNRFWRVLSAICGEDVPGTTERKKAFLLRNHIAVWDVASSCEIEGSADSSMKNVKANDITPILEKANIRQIFVNGKTAEKYFKKLIYPVVGRTAVCLPSTSPANAGMNTEKLIREWSVILTFFDSV